MTTKSLDRTTASAQSVGKTEKISGMHENLTVYHDEKKMATERAFGLTFTVVLTFLGILPFLKGEPVHVGLCVLGGLFGVITLFAPVLLKPLNLLWYRLGLLLHKLVTPVILAFIFYGVITPMGLLLRLMGKDLLRIRTNNTLPSFWIKRKPIGPSPQSLRKQY